MNTALIVTTVPIISGVTFMAIACGVLVWQGSARSIISESALLGLLGCWIAVSTAHFWIAGPYSYGAGTFDLGNALSRVLFKSNYGEEGLFTFEFGGGVDYSLISSSTGAAFSFNEWLVALLPIQLAYVVHKIGVVTISSVGVYLISRRAAGADTLLSAALAAFVSISSIKLTSFSFNHAFGHALVPLVVYVLVFRAGQEKYWTYTTAVSLFWAIASTPTHSGMGMAAALIAAWLFFGAGHRPQITFAILLFGAVSFANWQDGLWAKFLLGNVTYRGVENLNFVAEPLDAAWRAIRSIETAQWMLIIITLLAVGVGFGRKRPDTLRFLGAWATITFMAPVVIAVPWDALGVGLLNKLSWWNTYIGANAIFPFIIASVFRPSSDAIALGKNSVATFVVCLCLAFQSGYLLAHRSLDWLLNGGIRNMTTAIEALEKIPSDTKRAVSVPVMLEPNYVAAAGFNTLDGLFNPYLARKDRFWDEAIVADGPVKWVFLEREKVYEKFSGQSTIPAQDLFNIAALRAAHVGYVVSRVPLEGSLLHQIAGPADAVNPLIDEAGILGRIMQKVRYIVDPPPLLIYALSNPVPFAYSARKIEVVDESGPDYVIQSVRGANNREAVLEAPLDVAHVDPTMVIMSVERASDNVRFVVDAPHGGVLVVNLPFMPHWRARADKKELTLVPSNVIHMAIVVPANTEVIDLSYERPTLLARLMD